MAPVPSSKEHAERVSKVSRDYHTALAEARSNLQSRLTEHPDHHIFIGAAREASVADVEDLEENAAFAVPVYFLSRPRAANYAEIAAFQVSLTLTRKTLSLRFGAAEATEYAIKTADSAWREPSKPR